MKKFLRLIVAFVLMVSSVAVSFGQGTEAKAHSLDEADKYFLEFVLSDTTFEGSVSFSHTPLYNDQLEENGREYTFSVGNVYGYALMIEIQGANKTFYEIDELFYNKTSPFSNCEGLPVYITHNTYLEYKNQAFFDINSGLEVDDELVLQLAQKGFNYFGGTTATFIDSEIAIDYANKSTEEYSIQYDLPDVVPATNTSCANAAGACIITYYDRFCENLLPNFVPYITFGGAIFYRDNSAEVIQLTRTLGELMLIGEAHAGTTFSEFQLGMETYAENQGYTYTSTNVFSNGSFNFNNYKNSVENNKPVAIFLTNFTMLNGYINREEGQEVVSISYCPVSHVEVGCGYRIDTYYNVSGSVIATRTYLKVASGLNSYGIGYLSLNGESAISKAISTQIS